MIEFRDVAIRYPGASVCAVDGVGLTVGRGRLTAIVGPNGSGKSTLIRALLRTRPLERGTIFVDGLPLHAIAPRDFPLRVAVVPQREEPMFPMRVREYVALARYPARGLWRAESGADSSAISRALEQAEVGHFAARRTDELSGGEWQCVRVARALAQSAATIVLDEPATFMDIAHEMAMFELLARLVSHGTAVMVVSHHLNLVARFANEMVLLDGGRVAAAGSPAQVMDSSVLEPVYKWPLSVTYDRIAGAPALVPLRTGQTHINSPI